MVRRKWGARRRVAMVAMHSCPLAGLGARYTGGMNVYVRELARELARRGHQVDVFTSGHGPACDSIVPLAEGARLAHLNEGVGAEVPREALYADFQQFASGMEDFRKRTSANYDLVHSHYWLSGLVGEELRQGWGVPHLTMFHTMASVKNRTGVGEIESQLRLETERRVAAGCDRVIAATDRERAALRDDYGVAGEKVAVIPCGVSLDRFRPVAREEARRRLGIDGGPVVLYVGRLDPVKGLDRLLEAIALFPAPRRPRLVVVGGDGPDAAEAVRKAAAARGVAGAVSAYGPAPQSDLPLFYSAADVCAVPSHYESFGMVILESLACGTPVVAADVGAASGIIVRPELGTVVADNAPERLAGAIERALGAPGGSRDRLAALRRRAAAACSWQKVGDMVAAEYDALLHSHPRRLHDG